MGQAIKRIPVLLVEDEAMVAMAIEDMLLALGFDVVGPAPRVQAALDLMDRNDIALAVLDVNLGGETVFPVADRLAAEAVPFVFSTGYGRVGLEPRYQDRPVLQKPYTEQDLSRALTAARG